MHIDMCISQYMHTNNLDIHIYLCIHQCIKTYLYIRLNIHVYTNNHINKYKYEYVDNE
jgi:hypothetical protein